MDEEGGKDIGSDGERQLREITERMLGAGLITRVCGRRWSGISDLPQWKGVHRVW